jgi:hypothetical protein
VPETLDDACDNCHDQQKFTHKSLSSECQIETVSHYCDLHVSKKEKKIGPVQIYKSEFRIQENVSQSMYASTIFCSVYIESSFSFLFFHHISGRCGKPEISTAWIKLQSPKEGTETDSSNLFNKISAKKWYQIYNSGDIKSWSEREKRWHFFREKQ